jgi:hypothetical protein
MIRTFTQEAPKKKSNQDSYEKGRRFEEFIINLFNEHYFYQKKWRKSEKFTGSSLLIDHWNPDIEMELVFTGVKKYRFAVECKWRSEFKAGKIKWADDSQICAYRMFQDQVRIPVFVAIGIGGEPDNPGKLFLTPLNSIHMHKELYEKDLIPFKRKPTRNFYYNIHQLKLF